MGAQIEKTVFLLVEDNEEDVQLVKRSFQQSGIATSLQVVSDGVEAVRYLEGENEFEDRHRYPLPDVILLDLKMPRFSGFDFLEWLHDKSPGELKSIPVLVLAGSDEPADVKRAYALGANAYLVKPMDWSRFRERLQAINTFWSEHAETPVVAEKKKSR